MGDKLSVFSGRYSNYLTEKIVKCLKIKKGEVEIKNFSDGEISVKFRENVRGKDVFLIQSTPPPGDNLLELLLMIDAAKLASARRITAVIPYLGYARQDRKDEGRVPLSAKLVANLISTAGANRVLSMDLHSGQIPGFFDIPVDHLYAKPILLEKIKKILHDFTNPIVVAPDVGEAKVARSYAKKFKTGLILIDKERLVANKCSVEAVIGDPKDKDLIIIDDMVDTAGTLCNGVSTLKNMGAKKIIAMATHPLLSGSALEKIESSAIEKIYFTDTLREPKEKSDKLEFLSIAELLAEAIDRIHKEKSISVLFA